ncbi:HIT family protein [Rhizobium sp. 11515TR]|uniref:HIT family protein n=1 Tax=Rhizobium sp. 11515TR TaxID=2028343 RepID=UPI000BA8609A|nr:HIT family protein [Rhizobium sp. 11515TR]ASW09124.1 HIT family protein [Rhizobium sp. 11515TR]
MNDRQPFDLKAYVHDSETKPCFICGLVRNDPSCFHHRVFDDRETIIFLSKYPTLPGYCLVCPKEHREDLAQDLSTEEYLRLQEKVHLLSRALKKTFDAERIYVLSLGSRQANSHLHFHVVPLPAGVPLQEQQYHALMAEHGVLRIADDQMEQMALRIAEAYHSELTAS